MSDDTNNILDKYNVTFLRLRIAELEEERNKLKAAAEQFANTIEVLLKPVPIVSQLVPNELTYDFTQIEENVKNALVQYRAQYPKEE